MRDVSLNHIHMQGCSSREGRTGTARRSEDDGSIDDSDASASVEIDHQSIARLLHLDFAPVSRDHKLLVPAHRAQCFRPIALRLITPRLALIESRLTFVKRPMIIGQTDGHQS